MQQDRSRKLMVSLCCLALSSLFVLNNKAVVHADSVTDSNSDNAISWNSDSDSAQDVQKEDVQSAVQSKQVEQPDVQIADNNQQNVAPQSATRAETSTVRSSSIQRSTTVQNNATQSIKVSNVNDAVKPAPVVINNPTNNVVHVHYVNVNGKAVGMGDYDIKVDQRKNGTYNVPSGFVLANGSERFQINYQTRNVYHDAVHYPSEWDNPRIWGFNVYTGRDKKTEYLSSEEADFIANDPSTNDEYHEGGTGTTLGFGGQWYGYSDRLSSAPQSLLDKMADMFGTSDQSVWGAVYTEGTKIRDAYTEPAYNETVVISDTFTDNSGSATSNGNTVNVVLTKPQNVDPASDTRLQSSATRTIQINFPDGQIPEAYDGIVDKSGKLVQTVHFTRTATEDALTGNILQYGSWTSDNQDHNFIGFEARTLPRIPGYTLKITPVQA